MKADIWSLGCLIIHVILGELPIEFSTFKWERILKTAASIKGRTHQFLDKGVPTEITDLVPMCLQMDPDCRPDIEQVLKVLDKFDMDEDHEALLSPTHGRSDSSLSRASASVASPPGT